MKFATKSMRQCPCHLRHVATLPWKIKNSFFYICRRKRKQRGDLLHSY